MKRQLFDIIDTIHSDEQQETLEEIDKIKSEMEIWSKEKFEPVKCDVYVLNKVRQLKLLEQKILDY